MKARFFLRSILFHFLIVLTLALSFYFLDIDSRQHDIRSAYIMSYIEQKGVVMKEPNGMSFAHMRESSQTARQSLDPQFHEDDKSIRGGDGVSSSVAHPLASLAKPAESPDSNVLTALLHAAIERQQHYPPSALAMEREGRVTVTFRVNLDGNVSNVRVIQSSNTLALDEAALEAVRLAAPFKNLEPYLHAPQNFTIDIVFALNLENE